MDIRVHLELFSLDTATRASLTAFCDAQARRALYGDRALVDAATVILRREALPLVGERWTARVELRLRRPGAPTLAVDAKSRRPHRAIEEAVIEAWSALRRIDAKAAA